MFRRSLLAAGALAVASLPAQQVPAPSLGGYTIGQLWSEIGRAMPCHAGRFGLLYTQSRGLERHLRECLPDDTVRLVFAQDTLFEINISQSRTHSLADEGSADVRDALTTWREERQTWAVDLFGEPDSVTVADSSAPQGTLVRVIQTVYAHWRTGPMRRWAAEISITSETSVGTRGGWYSIISASSLRQCIVAGVRCDYLTLSELLREVKRLKPSRRPP